MNWADWIQLYLIIYILNLFVLQSNIFCELALFNQTELN